MRCKVFHLLYCVSLAQISCIALAWGTQKTRHNILNNINSKIYRTPGTLNNSACYTSKFHTSLTIRLAQQQRLRSQKTGLLQAELFLQIVLILFEFLVPLAFFFVPFDFGALLQFS